MTRGRGELPRVRIQPGEFSTCCRSPGPRVVGQGGTISAGRGRNLSHWPRINYPCCKERYRCVAPSKNTLESRRRRRRGRNVILDHFRAEIRGDEINRHESIADAMKSSEMKSFGGSVLSDIEISSLSETYMCALWFIVYTTRAYTLYYIFMNGTRYKFEAICLEVYSVSFFFF